MGARGRYVSSTSGKSGRHQVENARQRRNETKQTSSSVKSYHKLNVVLCGWMDGC